MRFPIAQTEDGDFLAEAEAEESRFCTMPNC
ncbi:hypothetical protein SAMN05444161_8628 [Rhizobiales bacterium GAS191]|nr:hypothetical protein SAMN05444161_8628 [Rhizobiales bacterium GAS191]